MTKVESVTTTPRTLLHILFIAVLSVASLMLLHQMQLWVDSTWNLFPDSVNQTMADRALVERALSLSNSKPYGQVGVVVSSLIAIYVRTFLGPHFKHVIMRPMSLAFWMWLPLVNLIGATLSTAAALASYQVMTTVHQSMAIARPPLSALEAASVIFFTPVSLAIATLLCYALFGLSILVTCVQLSGLLRIRGRSAAGK